MKNIPNWKGICFIYKNWRTFVHLVLKTKRFGVNNQWRSPFGSILGLDTKQIIWSILKVRPVIINYRLMRIRAEDLGFLTAHQCKNPGWRYNEDIFRLEEVRGIGYE